MTRPLSVTAILALVALACDSATDPSADEAAVIWATAVEPALAAATLAQERGDTLIDDAGLCPQGNRRVMGTLDSASIDISHTLNGCVATPPDGPGQFVMSGSVQLTGSIAAPSVDGEITWSSSVSGESGNCTPVTSSECR